jgi:hypothetical protein
VPLWASVSESLTPTAAAGSNVQVSWTNFSYSLSSTSQGTIGVLSSTPSTPVVVATIPVAAPLPTSELDCRRAWRDRSDCAGQGFRERTFVHPLRRTRPLMSAR